MNTNKTLTLNFYCHHLRHFVDDWLEPAPRGSIEVPDMHRAYDCWCRRHNVVHRKIRTYDLRPELQKMGVCLDSVRTRRATPGGCVYYSTSVVFVAWRLTRNARYAICDEPRTVFSYAYLPAGRR